MTNQNKTIATHASVEQYIDTLDDSQRADSRALITMMTGISGCEPTMWGSSIVGFDSYHYAYDSGREGDMCVIGFSARKGRLAVYLVDGLANYADELEQLGPHKAGKACLSIKRLSDIDQTVLATMLTKSYAYTKGHDGSMHRAV